MFIKAFILAGAFGGCVAAAPLGIDLTAPIPPAAACPYGPGTVVRPDGQTITADQRSFFLNGKPWVPIVGEFHYARYPRAEWREELLKLKAGGINTVSTYVFWIHHEEEPGKWDWSGQRSLRDFLETAQAAGLKAIVRVGPWCHGEVRNGGFPDWVQNSHTGLHSTDPAFLALVKPLFAEEAKQMQGLLWKDGGPVISIQLENECDRADYLLALKAMARAAGIDVPFYTVTGWQGGLPKSELIPLFGGYSDGFWGGSIEDYRKEFIFTDVRALNDLGAQLNDKNPVNSQLIGQFPYACAELGGGMMSAYGKRIQVDPRSVAALALGKLGGGNNMPGYYMYQGGTNPAGKLTHLNEAQPNQLPVLDYDFQAPLGAAGQVRETYGLLREQHLFLADFGAGLARMPPFFPEERPKDLRDFDTLRWDMRSDGKSGFLFFSNQQPYQPLPDHAGVQFALKTAAGTTLLPRQPTTIPSGCYGIWPVNLDCGGATLVYATAQLLCRVPLTRDIVYFLAATEGIAPELQLAVEAGSTIMPGAGQNADGTHVWVGSIAPGTRAAAQVKRRDGSSVYFVVLTAEEGRQLSRVTFAGRERVVLSPDCVFADGANLRLQAVEGAEQKLAIFPPVASLRVGGGLVQGVPDGLFSSFALRPAGHPPADVALPASKPAGPRATALQGADEASWEDAAVYPLQTPASTRGRVLLNIAYLGDAARVYVGDQLFDDNYNNGDPFPVPLWRIPVADWPRVTLKVLPYSDGLVGRMPAAARNRMDEAKRAGTRDRVTVSTQELVNLTISAP